MVGCTAGHHIDPFQTIQYFLTDPQVIHLRSIHVLLQARRQCLTDDMRLFMNLLQHEMRETAFFGRRHIPGHMKNFSMNRIAFQIYNTDLFRIQNRDIIVFQQIDIPRVREHRRNIRGNVILVLSQAHNQRTVFSSRIQFSGTICKHNSQRIGSSHTLNRLRNRLNRILLLPVIPGNDMRNDLRIRIGQKRIACSNKLFSQLCVILYNTIMYHYNAVVLTPMRMRIDIRGLSVSSPTSMAYSGIPLRKTDLRQMIRQIDQFPLRLLHTDP